MTISRTPRPRLFRSLEKAPRAVIDQFFASDDPLVWTVFVRATRRELAARTLQAFGHEHVRPGQLLSPTGSSVAATDYTEALNASAFPAEGEVLYAPRFGPGLILARMTTGAVEYIHIGDDPWSIRTPPPA